MSRILYDTLGRFSRQSRRPAKYIGDDGSKCAIGHHLTDEELESIRQIYNKLPIRSFINRFSFKKVRPKDLAFWELIQKLHDRPGNWGPSGGLTYEGKNMAQNIYIRFCSRKYEDVGTFIDRLESLPSH